MSSGIDEEQIEIRISELEGRLVVLSIDEVIYVLPPDK